MFITRRGFLQTSALSGAAATLGARFEASARNAVASSHQPAETKKVLILGGTRFLGPALVEAALELGHEVTLFNRGRSNPHLFPTLEKLIGDRDPLIGDGLKQLEGRQWDVVIDTSGFLPRIVSASAELLAENVTQYVFISTISVYADQSKAGLQESDEVATLPEPSEDVRRYYGPLKAECERVVEARLPGRTTIIRPGLIVGPEDQTDRFTWWPVRIDRGGEVLAPGSPGDPVQYIDVRDLARFCLRTIDARLTGVYNALGPRGRTNIAELLYGCKAVTGGSAAFTWVPAEFLAGQGVQPWVHMPVWVPADGSSAGITQVNNEKSVAKGLEFRPLADTVRDTLAWFKSLPPEDRARLGADAVYATAENRNDPAPKRAVGLSAQREREVLEAWAAAQVTT
jgi:2'-hydroxyisoflavone reductase